MRSGRRGPRLGSWWLPRTESGPRLGSRWLLGGLLIVALFTGIRWVRSQYVVPVLMYHEVDPRPIGESRLVVSPASFARQMAFLHDTGAHVVPLSEVIEAFRTGRRLHSRTVAITFDDGFRNVLTYAVPALRRYRFPATMFLVTDWIGKGQYMTWDEIRQLEQAGVTIGSHSVTHAWLPALGDDALRRELIESRQVLEKGLGHPVDLFCYPMGALDPRVKQAVRAAGYRGACATNPGRRSSRLDSHAIKRLRIWKNSDWLPVFWVETSGYYTWIKEHRKKKSASPGY